MHAANAQSSPRAAAFTFFGAACALLAVLSITPIAAMHQAIHLICVP